MDSLHGRVKSCQVFSKGIFQPLIFSASSMLSKLFFVRLQSNPSNAANFKAKLQIQDSIDQFTPSGNKSKKTCKLWSLLENVRVQRPALNSVTPQVEDIKSRFSFLQSKKRISASLATNLLPITKSNLTCETEGNAKKARGSLRLLLLTSVIGFAFGFVLAFALIIDASVSAHNHKPKRSKQKPGEDKSAAENDKENFSSTQRKKKKHRISSNSIHSSGNLVNNEKKQQKINSVQPFNSGTLFDPNDLNVSAEVESRLESLLQELQNDLSHLKLEELPDLSSEIPDLDELLNPSVWPTSDGEQRVDRIERKVKQQQVHPLQESTKKNLPQPVPNSSPGIRQGSSVSHRRAIQKSQAKKYVEVVKKLEEEVAKNPHTKYAHSNELAKKLHLDKELVDKWLAFRKQRK